ncbi:hypothetical protein [Sinorhizobium meliloti]|uniref:hypothetical protein n=1 Tax=Rhizobium meliloti TaxID=382 RepID=UPI000414B50A|nr:hypothetical protein [Sinorhizobium meliloti]
MGFFSDRYVRVYHHHLKNAGEVTSRYDQHMKIKRGLLPPPHKDGDTQQARAWWWAWEIDEAIECQRRAIAASERERRQLEAAE